MNTATKTPHEETLVEDMLYELDEIDAQIDELQAMFTARMLSSEEGWEEGALYEDMYDLKEDIGSFREALSEEQRDEPSPIAARASIREKCLEHMRHIKASFLDLRKHFLFQY